MTADMPLALDDDYPFADDDQLVKSEGAARFLAVSPYTINDYVKRGYLTPVHLDGRQRRFRVGELRRFIRAREG